MLAKKRSDFQDKIILPWKLRVTRLREHYKNYKSKEIFKVWKVRKIVLNIK